jgi:hypothetical protein
MSDHDKDTLETGEPNEFMPGEEEFEEDLETGDEAAAGAPMGLSKPGRRFGFGRSSAEAEAHPQGSVRATHERVHIDDRASALFALVCAVGMIAILVGSFVLSSWPAGPAPTLPPLNLETYSPPPATPTPVPTPTPVVTVAPSASAAPTAAPTATAS